MKIVVDIFGVGYIMFVQSVSICVYTYLLPKSKPHVELYPTFGPSWFHSGYDLFSLHYIVSYMLSYL